MRQITEVLTCDICGKQKTTQRVYIGVETKLERIHAVKAGLHRADEIYEVRPSQHICGKCADAVAAATTTRIAELQKKG